jgi:putative transposase
MPRFPRLVVPGIPHHVTQRGIRKQQTFFKALDYLTYLELVREHKEKAGVRIWSYCLMPNHVHMVVVPESESSLAKFFGTVHCQYASRLNASHGWTGHFWQQRFYSVAMDERHTLAAMRYVELNPVRAGLCKSPQEWRWSSIHANLGDRHDSLVDVATTKAIVDDWSTYIGTALSSESQDALREHTRTGRPIGDSDFIDMLEVRIGRPIRKRKTGPPKSS